LFPKAIEFDVLFRSMPALRLAVTTFPTIFTWLAAPVGAPFASKPTVTIPSSICFG
jgi:hypothetical protein